MTCCRRLHGRAWLGFVIALAIVVVSLLPWAARNRRVTAHWCWLTHRLGISLYDGVGPRATGAGDLGGIKAMPEVAELEVKSLKVALDAMQNSRPQMTRILVEQPVKLTEFQKDGRSYLRLEFNRLKYVFVEGKDGELEDIDDIRDERDRLKDDIRELERRHNERIEDYPIGEP